MENPVITSLSNPLVKQARSLRQKKARTETGRFLVEGIHPVGEAVEAGWEVESIFFSPELLSSEYARRLIARHPDMSQAVSAAVLESLADKENPQGILAVVRQRQTRLSDLHIPRISVALVAPQDPGNVGTILRTMDAVGAEVLFMLDPQQGTSGGVELYHPTVIRSSMGAIFWKQIVQTSFDEFMQWARAGGCQVIGTSSHADMDYQTLVPKIPWVLMMGNEQKGLSTGQINVCDVTVSLPMQGRVSSLNLAVAAGVLLYSFNKK